MEQKTLILQTMEEQNILPLTSRCNVKCIFCSHHNNPRGVKVVGYAPRPLEEVIDSLSFLSKNRKIIIGESSTKIVEGEPFSHPQIMEILAGVRQKFPKTLLSITTNGNMLTEAVVEKLAKLKPLELTVSLNSSNLVNREKLMGPGGLPGIKSLALLQQAGISYHGSIVAMPWLTGWADLENTVRDLAKYDAQTVRIFLPGYTKKTEPGLTFSSSLWQSLSCWVEDLAQQVKTILLLEPPLIANLKGVVRGVLPGTPAQVNGLKIKDVILRVNGEEVLSRVHAFRLLEKAGECRLLVERGGDIIELAMVKKRGERSGAVMDYDVDLEQLGRVERELYRRQAHSGAILTSVLAAPVLNLGLERLKLLDQVKVFTVPSVFFGGSIMAAGLLVVEDFSSYLNSHREQLANYPVLVLPAIAFDREGKDLTGRYYWELEEAVPGRQIAIC